MAALEPAEPESEVAQAEHNAGGSDIDAEGEDDMELDYSAAQTPAAENIGGDEPSESEMSNDQGEGFDEGEGEDAESDEEDFVGAVKVPHGQDAESEDDAVDEEGSPLNEDSADEAEDRDTDRSSNSAESVVAEEWEGGSEGADDGDAEVANRNNCIFCGQDEEHDPCEEYEEYMACAVCGDNSHRQCARDNNSLESDDEASKWRCPGCVSNALEPDVEEQPTSRRRSSASKFTRDLLPASRGVSRPGSHSVFNTLILDDDPLDGSRSLRKRKASSEQAEELSKASVKRRKKQSTVDESDSEVPQSPSHADDTGADVIAPAEALLASAGPGKADAEAGSTSINRAQHVRPARPRRPKKEPGTTSHARVVRRNSTSLVLSFQLDPSRLREVQPRKKRRRPPPGLASSTPRPRFGTSHVSHYATPFYSFHERENDELKSKPYGGILSETDADTSKTLPLAADRTRFEEARIKAEEDWKQKTASAEAENESKGRATQKVSGPPSKIKCINFGGYEIETWYAAPYPEEYSRNRVLYICEFCLKYMNSDYVAWRHKLKCPAKHPPGDEIYRDKSVSVFEVDGRKNPVYCQNLCLLAKLFLGSKTLYYDVEPFLFYIMTEYDELGCHFVGYFSKEKRPSSLNNVSCILTLPTHQRKGYGNLLIDFSYLLTRVEHKTGSPEKPLSDMGLVSYRNYWRLVLSYLLIDQKEPLSVINISERTGMTADDIVAALEALRALVRDPVTKSYALRLDYAYFRQCIESWEAKAYVKLNPDALIWTPYVMGRGNLANYDRAPPLATIAPREGDEEDPTVVPEEGVQQQLRAAAPASANDNTPKANGDTATSSLEPTTNGDHDSVSTPNTSAHPIITSGPPLLSPSLTRSSPEKPSINGIHPPSPPAIIPPTRYEVFPPVPGTTSRRRGGWRGGVRKSVAGTPTTATPARTGGKNLLPGKDGNTPRQTGLGLGKGKGKGKEQTPTGRRTRSTKDIDALDGAGKEADEESEEGNSSEEDEDEEAKDEDEVDNRGTGGKDEGEEADTPKDRPADQHGDAEDAMEE